MELVSKKDKINPQNSQIRPIFYWFFSYFWRKLKGKVAQTAYQKISMCWSLAGAAERFLYQHLWSLSWEASSALHNSGHVITLKSEDHLKQLSLVQNNVTENFAPELVLDQAFLTPLRKICCRIPGKGLKKKKTARTPSSNIEPFHS
jgi:hypothetical protein